MQTAGTGIIVFMVESRKSLNPKIILKISTNIIMIGKQIFGEKKFFLYVLHWEWSAPTACATGLFFLQTLSSLITE